MYKQNVDMHKMEHSDLEREENMTVQVNLEDIMLNEISQSQKDTYCIIPHI